MSEFVLLRHREIPNLDQLDVYVQNGGFGAQFRHQCGSRFDRLVFVIYNFAIALQM